MIMNAKRWTRELFEEYLERLPVEPVPRGGHNQSSINQSSSMA
jgi:hypothetical protein